MTNRTRTRRLERLEASLAPPEDEPALRIRVTSPGEPDEIVEVRGNERADRRRRPWPLRRVAMDSMQ